MEFKTRKIVMHADLNGASTLFGGRALSWIDEEAAVYAASKLNSSRIVTKKIGEVDFVSPALLGDIVEIGCELVRVGRTSITVSCVIRNLSRKTEIVRVKELVFVHLNEQGMPAPHGIIE